MLVRNIQSVSYNNEEKPTHLDITKRKPRTAYNLFLLIKQRKETGLLETAQALPSISHFQVCMEYIFISINQGSS